MMKKMNLGVIALISAMAVGSSFAQTIQVTDQPNNFIIEKDVQLKLDNKGFVLVREVELPAFEKGIYYRPYSGDVARGNRVEGVAFDSIQDLQDYEPSKTRKGRGAVQMGQFILLKINDGKYLALLPMLSQKIYTQFFLQNGKLVVKAGNFGTDTVEGDLPLLIWSYGTSPYSASTWSDKVAC